MALRARGLVILFLLVAALLSYAIGSMGGIVFFIGVGAVFELLFWFNLFRKKK
ncbi:MAG: hypothetical protein GKR91_15215 [Pseudomonadales bacterium]|nr:hypothetical protein [Pseudomonadales bacterium]